MNVITDILILCLPIRFVVRLQMKRARKLQVFVAFGLGGIVCIFGIIRCYYIGKTSTTDPAWTAAPGAIWSQVEVSVGIISACLPVYRPLFKKRSEMPGSQKIDSSSQPSRKFQGMVLAAQNEVYDGWPDMAALADGTRPENLLEDRLFTEPTVQQPGPRKASSTGEWD
ncbi:MAG: hypothetical protein Q9195_009049 [Heterodermia aff. obscurata]